MSDSKQIMAQNIQKYMDLNCKTRKDVCESIGVSYTTFTDWVKGNTYPRPDKVEKLADYFGIKRSDLVDPPSVHTATASPSSHAAPSAGMVKIPILGTVIAGYPRYAEENIIGYEDISEEQAKTGEYFCLKVTGTSMLPRFEEGDLLIIKVQDYIENGDIGIVLVDGDNATVKVVHESPVGITLLAYNTAVYQPTTYTREQIEALPVKVIGKVVGLRRDF